MLKWLGVDRQRGVSQRGRRAGRWGVFCNPLVLRIILALVRFVDLVLEMIQRQ